MSAPGKDKEKKRPSATGKRQSTKDDTGAEDFEAWMKSRQLVKPDDQLELTEAELAEEIPKTLVPVNTNIVPNLVEFSYKEKEFVPVRPEGALVNIYSLEGYCLPLESEEAKFQIDEFGDKGYELPAPRVAKSLSMAPEEPVGPPPPQGESAGEDEENAEEDENEEPAEPEEPEGEGEMEPEGEGEAEAEEEEGAAQAEAEAAAEVVTFVPKKRKLINQFNFCERATLTYVTLTRGIDTQTIPPPRSSYCSTVLQWLIYDTYAEDFAQQKKEHVKEKKSALVKKKLTKKMQKEVANELNKRYLKCWQVLERMINQNIFDEIANDYRYWEDPSDEYRDGDGTVLPLWKFTFEKTRRLYVTDLLFNPNYYDLFAVCYGSYEFLKQAPEGALCLFTIKNPSYPDYIFMTESGVMCCDIHPKYPFLVAIGMYDGNVAVYDLKEYPQDAIYVSQGVDEKHSESVAEIKWVPDMSDGEINLYSASVDGRVFHWILMQNKFLVTKNMTLYLEGGIADGPDGTQIRLKGCATCMCFHPVQADIFLIGTEEGLIYKCSTFFSSKYIITYQAHNLSVYRIDFNKFNSNIFASCSSDWKVKVWEDMRHEPLFICDLDSCVGDVKWAPYSSTVFGAVTWEGKVYIYDINVNKYKPICTQSVVPKRKSKLTRIAFNQKLPFIIVGDDKGATTSLKLSPNLRLMVKPPKKQPWLDQNLLQVQKLDRILSLARELPEGTVIKEVATTVQS